MNVRHLTFLVLYLLKTSENQTFSDVFKEYKETSGIKWVKSVCKYCRMLKSIEITKEH